MRSLTRFDAKGGAISSRLGELVDAQLLRRAAVDLQQRLVFERAETKLACFVIGLIRTTFRKM